MKNINKNYIILSIFILIFIILVTFFIYPTFKDIDKNSKDMISAKNDIIALGAQIRETKNFAENFATYKPNLDKIDKLFVDPDNPVDFIKFLESSADSCNLLMQISLSSSLSNQKESISLSFSLKGKFSDILKFTEEIEQGVYLIKIEKMTIQAAEKSVNAALTISALTL